MANIPARVAARIGAALKKFQPIVSSAKSRDVNESDTVVIVTDLLQELFGYDKYSDITSEHAIRGTFCDLAVRVDNELAALIEVKAIGHELKDQHVKQAVDYAANQGVDWVVLTNGAVWRIYKVGFGKPIEHELVVEIALLQLEPKEEDHLELLWLFAKEGWQKARLGEYHSQRQALSRFTLAALLLSESVLDTLRRELKRMTDGIKIQNEQIAQVLEVEVIKREVLEGDKAEDAKKLIARAVRRAQRASARVTTSESPKPAAGVDDASPEPEPQPSGA